MQRVLLCATILAVLVPAVGFCQDLSPFADNRQVLPLELMSSDPLLRQASAMDFDWLATDTQQSWSPDFNDFIVRGQDDGGGAGAAAATDPSVPLTQMQFQNVFVPESYNASGYSNQIILQPVIPLNISEDGFFPYHIIRPTLPIVAPSADPDGIAETQGGLADLTLLDVYVHPFKQLKTNVGIGYTAILPTATHPQLGLREWQLGPTVFAVNTAVPNWNFGALYQQLYSFESNAYKLQVQLIAVRMLHDHWYVGWGELLWTLDDQNGDYNIPLNARLGKVVSVGNHKLNIFLQPSYTPEGLHSTNGGSKWDIKLNVTFLFPGAKLYDPILSRIGCGSCCCE